MEGSGGKGREGEEKGGERRGGRDRREGGARRLAHLPPPRSQVSCVRYPLYEIESVAGSEGTSHERSIERHHLSVLQLIDDHKMPNLLQVLAM